MSSSHTFSCLTMLRCQENNFSCINQPYHPTLLPLCRISFSPTLSSFWNCGMLNFISSYVWQSLDLFLWRKLNRYTSCQHISNAPIANNFIVILLQLLQKPPCFLSQQFQFLFLCIWWTSNTQPVSQSHSKYIIMPNLLLFDGMKCTNCSLNSNKHSSRHKFLKCLKLWVNVATKISTTSFIFKTGVCVLSIKWSKHKIFKYLFLDTNSDTLFLCKGSFDQ